MQIDVPDDIISHIVKRHINEAGMRGVEKSINSVVSSLALAQMYGDVKVLGETFKDASLTKSFVEAIMETEDQVYASSHAPSMMYL